ncbi:MAG: hypothetical protein LPH21_18415 [Shewanella sp.]|nr:hypothetical protein [Shewanella sp.]
MGCDSVYRKGYCNRIYNHEEIKIRNAVKLGYFLDQLFEECGGISVSYGFISAALSNLIVKYQDPSKPSMHRWDLGAACDIKLHERDDSPIRQVADIAEYFGMEDFARIITYSESEWICFATSNDDNQSTRRIYENRYTGQPKVKPDFIHWKGKEECLFAARDNHELDHPGWRGAGYPTHHGGGRLQYHHETVGRVTPLSDFLYNRDSVYKGVPNRPPEDLTHFHRAANLLEAFGSTTDCRLAIVGAYHSDAAPNYDESRSYKDGFYLEGVPSEGAEPDAVIDVLKSISETSITVDVKEGKVDTLIIRG